MIEYSSKILLFGEYTVLRGGRALLMPFRGFSARLVRPGRVTGLNEKMLNRLLSGYMQWLKRQSADGPLKDIFNFEAFKRDIKTGVYLDSDIPDGYGLGSSGALCAAVYSRYAVKPLVPVAGRSQKEAGELMKIFSIMESRFHGQSSGLDPLCIYLGMPVLSESGQAKIHEAESSLLPVEGISAFLVDTGSGRETGPLVDHFNKLCRESLFIEKLENELLPAVDGAIDVITGRGGRGLKGYIRRLSELQLSLLVRMVPEAFREIWETGLSDGSYFLKLCGAGGGGFLLGFTSDIDSCRGIFKNMGTDIIEVDSGGTE